MPTYSENKIISLNSAFGIQQNGTSLSNMLFATGLILEEEGSIIDSHISVINCQLPVSFYTITTANNVIRASFGGGAYSSYLIPIGNYNSNSLITAFQTLFGVANSITVSFNSMTGCFSFESATQTVFVFNFNVNNSAYSILGFLKISYSTTTSVIISPYPINLLGVKRISIKSYNLGVSSFNSNGADTTLCVIPNDQPSWNMISYQNQNNIDKQKIRIKTINSIDIQIYDENNNLLNFNNVNWTITLCLENVRFKPEITSTFREIINNTPIENEKIDDKDLDQVAEPLETKDEELDLLT